MKNAHKEALLKIGSILKRTIFSKQKFESGKLSDGTVIEYTALEVGGEISIKDKDDNVIPAPVGELELEDGRIVVVTEVGKIAEIKDAAPKAGEEKPAKEGEEKPAKLAEEPAPAEEGKAKGSGLDWTVQIEDLKRSLAWQAERVASLVTAMEMFKKDASDVFAEFQAYVELDVATGSGAITGPKQTVFTEIRKNKEEAATRAIASFKAFNKKLKDKDKDKKTA